MKVSVIIPVYNREKELKRALNSLCDQTFTDFEVIICDDGSDIPLNRLVETYAKTLSIKLRRIENFGRPSRPRNVALKEAAAPWVAFLDSDDWWLPNRLETIMQNIDRDTEVIYHPLVVRSNGERKISSSVVGRATGGDILYDMAINGNPIALSGAVVRKSILKCDPFDEAEFISEDFDLWLYLAANGATFRFINQKLGFYWAGSNSRSALSPVQIRKRLFLFEKHKRSFNNFSNEAESAHFLRLGALYYRLGNFREALNLGKTANSLPSWNLKLKRYALIILSYLRLSL